LSQRQLLQRERPTIVIRIEITAAKIGRSMKKRENPTNVVQRWATDALACRDYHEAGNNPSTKLWKIQHPAQLTHR
jgi:hypothetical protein